MQKYVIAAIAVILAGGCIYYWVVMRPRISLATTPTPSPVELPTTDTYATTTYSIDYPKDFTINDAYAYQGVPNKPIPGVKFIIPATMATGTNLSADSGVSIEQLPHAKNCAADIYFEQNVRPHDFATATTTYSMASSTDAGAGNFYEEQVFAIPNSHPCTAVRYFIHSTNIGNYPPGTVTEFDRSVLLADFDSIRDSLILSQ